MEIHWKDGFKIKVEIQGDGAVLSANREGLLSLAGIMASLADECAGDHIHLDEYNSLENGSDEIIIVKID